MMKEDSLKSKYIQKELEVNALMEITQAVNNNLPEENLYKIYEFTLRANLHIKKLALYVQGHQWDCQAQFGTSQDFRNVNFDHAYLEIRKTTSAKDVGFKNSDFNEFTLIIPVLHKEKLLAYVFVKPKASDAEVDTTFLQALSNVVLVAIENKRLARKEMEQLAFQRDMEIAKNVQNYLFPKDLPKTKLINIEAFYLPCRTVGGDYYDYIVLEDEGKFVLCIADVSGKGIPAALIMSNFQAALRTIVRKAENLTEVIEELNYQLCKNANRESFITVFLASYDFKRHELKYINAGHNPPFLMNEDREPETLDLGTTVLGVFEQLPFIESGIVKNLTKFNLFLYTDGLTETFNEQEEEFGSEKLMSFLSDHRNESLPVLHEDLMNELNAHKKGLPFTDDLTFLSCRVNNGSS